MYTTMHDGSTGALCSPWSCPGQPARADGANGNPPGGIHRAGEPKCKRRSFFRWVGLPVLSQGSLAQSAVPTNPAAHTISLAA